MYVETDFLIALAKPDDWLNEEARAALDDGAVHTSLLSYAEFLTQAYEPGEGIDFDVPRVVANLLELVPIEPKGHEDAALAAATFLDEHEVRPFDAFHAGIAITGDGRIQASDRVYDELGLERIALEPGG